MKQFIFDARNGIHIIDLSKTHAQLEAACDFLTKVVSKGGQVLFVGTKKQAQESIAEDVASKLLSFVNRGSTTGAVNVPQVELPEQTVDAAAPDRPQTRPHRLLHFHRNVPGVLRKMHTLIADLGANISAEYLRTSADLGYVAQGRVLAQHIALPG